MNNRIGPNAFARARRRMALGLSCAAILALGACSALPDLPFMQPAPDADGTQATYAELSLKNLVDHINCQMQQTIAHGLKLEDEQQRAIDKIAAYKADKKAGKPVPALPPPDPVFTDAQRAYTKLIADNFVAAIELSVKVTNSEGASPSLSFINPLKLSSTNATFNANGQLTGTQDRNFDFSYVVDLSRLARSPDIQTARYIAPSFGQDMNPRPGDPVERPPTADEMSQQAATDALCVPGDSILPANEHEAWVDRQIDYTGIGGDLGLDQTVRNGLDVMNTAAAYNVYSSKGPTAAELPPTEPHAVTTSRELSAPTPESAQLAQSVNRFSDAVNSFDKAVNTFSKSAKSAGAKPDQQQASQNQTTTKFSTTVNFTIVTGVNGGPTWNLKYFKGPGGSTGPLSLSRTYLDTLVVTFAPTCRRDENEKRPLNYWHAVPECTDAVATDAARDAQGHTENLSLQNALSHGIIPFTQ